MNVDQDLIESAAMRLYRWPYIAIFGIALTVLALVGFVATMRVVIHDYYIRNGV